MTINLKEHFKKLQIGKSSTYKNMTLFQAMNVDHSVADGSWTTTIKGQVRIAMDNLYEVINIEDDTGNKDVGKINDTVESKTQGPPLPPPPAKVVKDADKDGKDDVTPTIEARTFEEAFKEARLKLGKDAAFIWNGNDYVTRYDKEGYEGTQGMRGEVDLS